VLRLHVPGGATHIASTSATFTLAVAA
jgi:hypothetical protein